MIKLRSYNRELDFDKVSEFLVETYEKGGKYPNWLQPRWEYMHFHPILNVDNLNKIGIWEDDGKIVAIATYEDDLGEVYFGVNKNYTYLKKEMFEYAEKYLSKKLDNGKRYLEAYINDFDEEFMNIAEDKGYTCDKSYPEFKYISQYVIPEEFPEIVVPEGYTIKSLKDDNDFNKINRVMWRGFNHPGEPLEEDLAGRKLMQSGPHFRHDLTIVVVAPNGDYASFSGAWYEAKNKICYIEPVATDPTYRKMGLGKAAVLEGIRRCKEEGCEVAFVESGQKFYEAVGFKRIFARYPWKKEF